MAKKFTIKITNLTDLDFPLYQKQEENVTWKSPEIVQSGETIETRLTFHDLLKDEKNYGLLQFATPNYKDFQVRAYSQGGDHLKTFTSFDIESSLSEQTPIINKEVLTISFNEIPQKKGEPCSSKKDAKKAKENKSKGKRPT